MQAALASAGFVVADESHDWEFPSYTDPIAAEKAGHPNSGHTPRTAHPETLRHLIQADDHEACTLDDEGEPVECPHVNQTEERPHKCKHVGEPYAADPRIVFLTVTHTDERAIDQAQDIADKLSWSLRAHWETFIPRPKKPSTQEMIDAAVAKAVDSALGKVSS